MQTSTSLLVGIVSVLYVCTNVVGGPSLPLCTSLVACVHPENCEPIKSCPKGLVVGYPPCGCCKKCVIPEGQYCFNEQVGPDGSPQCERGLTCCRGVCSSDCQQSTTTDGLSTSTTETSTTEE